MGSAWSAPPPASLAGGRDKSGGSMGHGHDRDHGVDTRRTGEGTAVGDEQALNDMRLVIGTDDGGCRVIAHATRAHLVEAEVPHLPRTGPAAGGRVHESLSAAPRARALCPLPHRTR